MGRWDPWLRQCNKTHILEIIFVSLPQALASGVYWLNRLFRSTKTRPTNNTSKMQVSAINAYKIVLSVFSKSVSERVESVVEVEAAETQTHF